MQHHHTPRIILAGVLALMAALAILYGTLSYLAWQSGENDTVEKEQYTDEEKMQLLGSLKSSTTVPTSSKEKALLDLRSSSSASVSEEEKLKILEDLR